MRKLLAFMGLGLLVAGCGGGGASASRSAKPATGPRFTIVWPERQGRFIPLASNSVVVSLYDKAGTTLVKAYPAMARPTEKNAQGQLESSLTLTGLVYGDYRVKVSAYPEVDGTGTVQAMGEGPLHVDLGTNESVVVSLVSQVDHLALSAPTLLRAGASKPITATAYDAQNRMVLLKAASGGEETLAWSSDNEAAVKVSGTGSSANLTAGTVDGTATIKARFSPEGSAPIEATASVASTASAALYKDGVVVLAANAARKATLEGSTVRVSGDVSDIKVGTIILCGQGEGFTQRVTAVNGDGTFATVPATIEDAIQECDVTLERTVDAGSGATFVDPVPGVTNASGSSGPLKVSLTNVDLALPGSAGLKWNGTLSLGFRSRFRLLIVNGVLKEFTSSHTAEVTSNHRCLADPAAPSTPVAGGTAALGTFVLASRELVPGVAITPRISVVCTTGNVGSVYPRGTELQFDQSYTATLDHQFDGGNWFQSGNETATASASLVVKAPLPRGYYIEPPAPQMETRVNGGPVELRRAVGVQFEISNTNVNSPLGVASQIIGVPMSYTYGNASHLGGSGADNLNVFDQTIGAYWVISDKTYLFPGSGDVTIR